MHQATSTRNHSAATNRSFDDEVRAAIDEARFSEESDDYVVGWLLRAAIGRRPD